jgi:VWFA-related protein
MAQAAPAQETPVSAAMTADVRQQNGAEASAYTLKVYTDLVVLDVVVRDAKGNLVKGLQRDDFSVKEDGVAQQLDSIEETTSPAGKRARQEKVESTQELDLRTPEAPVTIFVLDELTTRFEDEYFARYSLRKYLSRQGEALDQPVMLVARTVDRTMLLCDYTTSKKKVIDALNHHLVGNDWRNRNPNFADVQTSAAFASLIEVAKATEGHRGHKNLVWVGRGFPSLQWDSLQDDQAAILQQMVAKCVEILRKARVTLYAIDPAGVTVEASKMDQNDMATPDDPWGGAVSFESIVQSTGGQSMHGRNDVDRLIDDAVDDGKNFYTLSYRSSLHNVDDMTKFRAIKITVKDGTLTASTRQGYFPAVAEDSQFLNAREKTDESRAIDLAAACSGLMVFDGMPLTISRPGPASGRIQLSFPASAAGLELSNGRLRGDVTLITLSYDRAGKLLAKDGRVVSLHLPPLPPGQVESRKIQIESAINPQLAAARVRLVVRSHSNGKIGADNLFLADPKTLRDPATGLKQQK